MGRVERNREMARRRNRTAKLKKLRVTYEQATRTADKSAVVEKVQKISPLVNLDKDA